jgi:hypothetical protein
VKAENNLPIQTRRKTMKKTIVIALSGLIIASSGFGDVQFLVGNGGSPT